MGETLWPLLTLPGEEGRDVGATPWPLLTPSRWGLVRSVGATSHGGQGLSLVRKTVAGKPTEKCDAAVSVAWRPSGSGIGSAACALVQ